MSDWDAAQYSKFKRERTLPASDLAHAIAQQPVRSALDVGCGIGNSTAVLAQTFPGARIVGADNSPDMLAAARKANPNQTFVQLNAETELDRLNERFDVVFSNACIQWIPNHPKLLRELFGLLNNGGVLAVQVPQQDKHPVHRILRTLAASDKWRSKIGAGRVFYNLTENEYFDALASLTNDFRMWEVTYFHAMPSHESIVEWYRGTGLRPYLAQLSAADAAEFERDFLACVQAEYPVQSNGAIIFRFPRLFFTAKKQ